MDAGYVLTNFPPIIRNMFKHLTCRELDTCAEVCVLWKRIAETEKNRREDIFTFFQVLPCIFGRKSHSNFLRECTRKCIADELESDLIKQLKEVKIKPTYCLSFATNLLVEKFEQFFPSFHFPYSPQPSDEEPRKYKPDEKEEEKAYLKEVIKTALGQYLPKNCEITFCAGAGIIGCLQTESRISPLEIEFGYAVSGIMIPFVPGVHIFQFPMDEENIDISKRIPNDFDIKCLLVFTTLDQTANCIKLVQSARARQDSKIAIGGTFIEYGDTESGSWIAFCGNCIKAASVVVEPKDRETEVESKLKLFQDTGLLEDRCFALVFACVARGVYTYNRFNVESSIFNALYPEVPLLGVSGFRELGVEYLPNVQNRTHQKCLHQYTSIFVLISMRM